jgi:hypothetical protein
MSTVPIERRPRAFADAEAEFTRAWSTSRYTRVTLESVDVRMPEIVLRLGQQSRSSLWVTG